MQSSGWKPGTALGASSIPIPAHETSAAKVRIAVKDDMLGLGASLKSKNVEHQRTGLDAFQGLLGRLNAKSEEEVKEAEKKTENKKLATFAQGRWGGMVFVPGGLLVQEDPRSTKADEIKGNEDESASPSDDETNLPSKHNTATARAVESSEERANRKAEKRRRKEERRIRREAKKKRRLVNEASSQSATDTPDTAEETTTGTSTPLAIPEANITTATQHRLRNGRHLLRGKNIHAKSNVGIVNGLNATEMREIFDAMRHDAPMGATVAETLERLKGINMTDEDKENSRLRDQVKSDVESARGNRRTFEEFMRERRGERGSLNAQVTDVEDEDDQEIVD
ncbi:telomerase inhibitor [Lithohypha guttulata]|uniref:telomerase inhibitor n=1 Tax=Lithohypha guttulata TaxID=1690604 RepID=UPI002DDE9AF7|nr:telomerase inhibitor [Lithohypha guttulata]